MTTQRAADWRLGRLGQRPLLLGLLVLAAAGPSLVAWHDIEQGAARQRQAARRHVVAAAEQAVIGRQRWLAETEGLLAVIALDLSGGSGLSAGATGRCADLARWLGSHYGLASLELLTVRGRILCPRVPAAGDATPPGQAYVRRALASGRMAAAQAEGGLVPVALPIAGPDGQAAFLLLARRAAPAPIAPPAGLPGPIVPLIVDGPAALPAPLRDLPAIDAEGQTSGVVEATGSDGVDRIYGFSGLATAAGGVRAVVAIDRERLLGPVEARRRMALARLAVLWAGPLVLGWLILSRLLFAPLDRLAAGLARLGSGRLAWRFGARLQIDEIATVTDTLNRLLDRLEQTDARLRLLSLTDPLLGIANRRRLDEVIAQEWRRTVRTGEPLAFLMIDIDHFKAFNDTYGHQEGDACLRRIAEIVAAAPRRPGDLAARYGGEELAVLLPDTESRGAAEVARRIHDRLAAAAIVHASSPVAAHVTVSIGVAALVPARGGDPASLIALADRALYQAKQSGRNRTVTASPDALVQ